MTTASEALQWMQFKASRYGDRLLFRGQNRVWPSIKPSITRDDKQTQLDMWSICRSFVSATSGVAGYFIQKEHDRLAILQHYIGRSPVIDLTGTPIIALYFALLNTKPGDLCVVYSVDRSFSTGLDIVFSDHLFLALPLTEGGSKHRWLRQDGFSVGPAEWRDLSIVQGFDLLNLPGIESKCFIKGDADDKLIYALGNLEDTEHDPLARKVRGVINSVALELKLPKSSPIWRVLNDSNTRDPDSELLAEIDRLLSIASTSNAPDSLLKKLKDLRTYAGTKYWDMSFNASLDLATKEVNDLASPAQ